MGAKKTLVILPGWGGSHETWQQFMDIAKSDFDVVCIDLPCFGGVPCPATAWGVEEYSDFATKRIKELACPEPGRRGTMNKELVLLGHSFGGQVATYLTAKHPELISKLILSGPAIVRPRKKIRRVLFGAIAKVGKFIFRLPVIENFQVFAKKVLYKTADSPDYGDMTGIRQDIFKKIIRQDLRYLLPTIKTSTLLIWGTKDVYVPLRHGKKAVSLFPNARLHIVDGGKHGLHLQDVNGFYQIVRDFAL